MAQSPPRSSRKPFSLISGSEPIRAEGRKEPKGEAAFRAERGGNLPMGSLAKITSDDPSFPSGNVAVSGQPPMSACPVVRSASGCGSRARGHRDCFCFDRWRAAAGLTGASAGNSRSARYRMSMTAAEVSKSLPVWAAYRAGEGLFDEMLDLAKGRNSRGLPITEALLSMPPEALAELCARAEDVPPDGRHVQRLRQRGRRRTNLPVRSDPARYRRRRPGPRSKPA